MIFTIQIQNVKVKKMKMQMDSVVGVAYFVIGGEFLRQNCGLPAEFGKD